MEDRDGIRDRTARHRRSVRRIRCNTRCVSSWRKHAQHRSDTDYQNQKNGQTSYHGHLSRRLQPIQQKIPQLLSVIALGGNRGLSVENFLFGGTVNVDNCHLLGTGEPLLSYRVT